MGYFETARDRATYATHEWRLRRQMRRNRMPNPNPAQPPHEPVLQHIDPPDLYELPEEHEPDEAPAPVTAGAVGEPVDGFGNAIRYTPDPASERDEDDWHVCDEKADEIRADQDAEQERRHANHEADLQDNPGEEPVYQLGVDPAVAESEHEAHADDPVSEPYEPGAYNKTDDMFMGEDGEQHGEG